MKKRLNRIIKYLKDNYNAKSIIMTGSRVVGDYDSDSDWDFFVFTSKLKENEVGRKYSRLMTKRFGLLQVDGERLDIFFLPYGTTFLFSIFDKKLRYVKVVLDTPNKYAYKLIEKSKKIYGKGPEGLPKHEMMIIKQKSEGYNKKFDYLLRKKQYAQLFERIGWYFSEIAVPSWFDIRKEWKLRPQQAFDYIKKKDPKFYGQLKIIFSEKSYKQKVEACKKIHKILFS